jgi:hypothetical protein
MGANMNGLFNKLQYRHIDTLLLKSALSELKNDNLMIVYLYLDMPDDRTYRKKDFYDITKVQIPSRLDEWIYSNLVTDEEYGQFLDKYRPLKAKLCYDDIDRYILERHYYRKAKAILRKRYKTFNLTDWTKLRNTLRYERKKEIVLSDEMRLPFDFRNSLETYFISETNGVKYLRSIGGSGGSSQRYNYSFFNTVYYFLRNKKIHYYLFRYTGKNELVFIKELTKPVMTVNLGSNYHLEKSLQNKIRRTGTDFEAIRKHFGLLNTYR